MLINKSSSPKPETLSQLLLMQSILCNLPDKKTIFSFVCKGLLDVPGVEEATHSDKHIETDEPLHETFPLKISDAYHGYFLIKISDFEAYSPYIEYLKNFFFMITVILEERKQRQLNISHQDKLEEQVIQRSKELVESERRFKGFFEHTTDYVLVLEPEEEGKLIIVDCNEAACKKHGYLRDEILGKPITFLVYNPLLPDKKRFERLIAGETITFEVIHKKKDNSTFPAEATVKLLEIDGRLNFISIERDITERK